jgi:cobalt-zinc-cadmium efflux system protein
MANCHDHQHGHCHTPAEFGRAFAVGVALNTLFIALEVVFGLRAHSVALLADAGHNVSDVVGLLMAWGATVLAVKPPTSTYTYGFRGTSILAAFSNSLLLLVAVGAIGWEAIQRLLAQPAVAGSEVAWVAAAGIVINTSVALMFMRGRHHDLNIRAAFLHMATDAAISLGVLISGLLISRTGWFWLDPAVSLAIVAVIIGSTWTLMRDAFKMATQGVPSGIAVEEIRDHLLHMPGIAQVHDLHVWSMSTTEVALTAHVVAPASGNTDRLLSAAAQDLREKFGIDHVTLQIERGDPAHPCLTDCEEASKAS